MFDDFPQTDFEVVAPDGSRRKPIKGVFSGHVVLVADAQAVILVGDELRRRLPNQLEETYDVVDPVFFADPSGLDAHYQVKIRRKGAFQPGTGGNYSVHVSGDNARVNISSTDKSNNTVFNGDVFSDLRLAIQNKVPDPEYREKLLIAVEEMKQTQRSPGFAAAYQKFVGLSADHLGVITPFLPALSQLFG